MINIAICLSTKDRTELSEQAIAPLLQPNLFDLWITDGSTTDEGKAWPYKSHKGHTPLKIIENVRGGADAAIVHNLTHMLSFPHYDYVGLVENDVLLDPDWFEPTMALFEYGVGGLKDPALIARYDLFPVGAVSARSYEDRILTQRDGYAVMHNLGAGMVVFTRDAARKVLEHYRTTFTLENCRVFAQLSGIDIGPTWAFKDSEHWLTADWGFDKILAEHGYASLALTPSKATMIGQTMTLAEQGLTLTQGPIDRLRNDNAFDRYCASLVAIRSNEVRMTPTHGLSEHNGRTMYFAHQCHLLGADFGSGPWKLKWAQGFGPFGWQADGDCEIRLPVFGPCSICVSGPHHSVQIDDQMIGPVPDVISSVQVPCGFNKGTAVLRMSKGAVFHGVSTTYPQPHHLGQSFDYPMLPPP